jgi:hypothetical protein
VQAGVRQLQRRLDTRGSIDPAARGPLYQELEQGGLADPGLTAQCENLATARPNGGRERPEGVAFLTSPPQPGPGSDTRDAQPPAAWHGATHVHTGAAWWGRCPTGFRAAQSSTRDIHGCDAQAKRSSVVASATRRLSLVKKVLMSASSAQPSTPEGSGAWPEAVIDIGPIELCAGHWGVVGFIPYGGHVILAVIGTPSMRSAKPPAPPTPPANPHGLRRRPTPSA